MWKSACLGLCGLALSAAPAMALDTKLPASCKPVKPEIDISKIERKIQLPQESTYKAMQKAQDPIGREAYDEALAILLPVIERNEDRAYDNAWVRTQVSFIYASKKQWNKAIEHSRAALSKNILSATQELQIRNNMMYFYLAAENYAKALEAALEYFKYAPSPTADNLALLASVYFEAGKKREAVCPLHQAINMSKDVKKSWYDFFYSLHAELQDFEGWIVVAPRRVVVMHTTRAPVETRQVNITVETLQAPSSGGPWHLGSDALQDEIVIERHNRQAAGGPFSLAPEQSIECPDPTECCHPVCSLRENPPIEPHGLDEHRK